MQHPLFHADEWTGLVAAATSILLYAAGDRPAGLAILWVPTGDPWVDALMTDCRSRVGSMEQAHAAATMDASQRWRTMSTTLIAHTGEDEARNAIACIDHVLGQCKGVCATRLRSWILQAAQKAARHADSEGFFGFGRGSVACRRRALLNEFAGSRSHDADEISAGDVEGHRDPLRSDPIRRGPLRYLGPGEDIPGMSWATMEAGIGRLRARPID